MADMEEIFNHDKAGRSDQIALVAELEHIRRHALRSATVADSEENPELAFQFLVLAKEAQSLRRKYMQEHFPNIDSKYWCLCKSAACLRQISYEVGGTSVEELRELDNLVDEIWGKALGEDLSDCEACRNDMEA